MSDKDFDSTLHGVVEAQFHLGHELHLMTSNAYGTRVANLRLNRIIPSDTGYTGYTKQGFMITRNEARTLCELLQDLVNDDDAWEEPPQEIIELEETSNDE